MDDAVEIRDAFERHPAMAIWPPDKPGIDADAEEQQAAPAKYANIRNPSLTIYEPPREARNGAAAVICPGGGYGRASCVNEGHPVAVWLNSLGVSAYVLKYRLPATRDTDYHHPIPLADAQRAMRLVRGFAPERGLDPDRIGIVGFSAGGHLAATACTLYDRPVDSSPVSCRPDFSILVYSVMCFVDRAIYHGGSRENLLGPRTEDAELCRLLSPNLQVTAQTPPAFLAHAKSDGAVPYQNSVVYHEALKAAGVPTQLHLYDEGSHGFGMGEPHQDASQWPAAAESWLREMGFIGTVGQV
jgi:acetyl esterase/lipase